MRKGKRILTFMIGLLTLASIITVQPDFAAASDSVANPLLPASTRLAGYDPH